MEFDANRFYGRRYARVWPFFALLVVFDFALEPSAANLCQSFADLTLAFAFLPHPDIKVIGVGWFLGLVFLFYMIFPWFAFLLRSRRRAWFAMAVSVAFHVVLVRYFLTPEFCTAGQIAAPRHNIVYSFPFFMAGGLLYLYRDMLDGWKLPARLAILVAALAATVLQFTPFQPQPFAENILYVGFVFVLWVAYVATGGIAIRGRKLLDNRVGAFLGSLSMEIYLCHMMVFCVLEKVHPERFVRNPHVLYWGMCAAGLAGSIAFSWVVTKKSFPHWAKWPRRFLNRCSFIPGDEFGRVRWADARSCPREGCEGNGQGIRSCKTKSRVSRRGNRGLRGGRRKYIMVAMDDRKKNLDSVVATDKTQRWRMGSASSCGERRRTVGGTGIKKHGGEMR